MTDRVPSRAADPSGVPEGSGPGPKLRAAPSQPADPRYMRVKGRAYRPESPDLDQQGVYNLYRLLTVFESRNGPENTWDWTNTTPELLHRWRYHVIPTGSGIER